jgi:hypothetical protein
MASGGGDIYIAMDNQYLSDGSEITKTTQRIVLITRLYCWLSNHSPVIAIVKQKKYLNVG